MTSSPPAARQPASTMKAAEDRSPGTAIGPAASVPPPATVTVDPERRTGQPRRTSIRSVWSRVTAGSVTEVSPAA